MKPVQEANAGDVPQGDQEIPVDLRGRVSVPVPQSDQSGHLGNGDRDSAEGSAPLLTRDETAEQSESGKKRFSVKRVFPLAIVAFAVGLLIGFWYKSILNFLVEASPAIGALATIAIAWFTYTLWDSTRGMLEAARDQGEIANSTLDHLQREFVAAHPPRLVIRRIYWNDPSGCGEPVNGDKIRFTVTNEGGTPAWVNGCRVSKWVVDKPWGTLPRTSITRHTKPLEPFLLASGQSEEKGFGASEEKLTTDLYRKMLAPNTDGRPYWAGVNFWLMGDISYRDMNDVGHRMAFCRRYNPDTKRFEIETDPDYEYSG